MRILLIFSLICTPLIANEPSPLAEDEIKRLEDWIQITEEQLELQKKLKKLMIEFRLQKDQFTSGNENKSFIANMIKTAKEIFILIRQAHIEHLFPSDYLKELALFKSIGEKKQPKPS